VALGHQQKENMKRVDLERVEIVEVRKATRGVIGRVSHRLAGKGHGHQNQRIANEMEI
jgi:hypothetical protein